MLYVAMAFFVLSLVTLLGLYFYWKEHNEILVGSWVITIFCFGLI